MCFYLQVIAKVTKVSISYIVGHIAQKMKFSIKDFSSKYDQIRSLLRI